MTKLIVEMDMPTRCAECRVRLSCKWFIYNFLYSNSTEYLKPQTGDPKCLIKGVLPDEYGDLIDRDELFETINSRVTLIDSCPEGKPSMKELFERDVLCVCLHDVVCAKAVIVAEREEDEHHGS